MFPCPAREVYAALIDLRAYPEWSGDLVRVSHRGPLALGLKYETETQVMGHKQISRIEVVRLVPDKEIELINDAGLISYRLLFRLIEHSPGETELVCVVRFEFNNLVMELARPQIEAMAESRIGTDLENLRARLAGR